MFEVINENENPFQENGNGSVSDPEWQDLHEKTGPSTPTHPRLQKTLQTKKKVRDFRVAVSLDTGQVKWFTVLGAARPYDAERECNLHCYREGLNPVAAEAILGANP